MIPNRNALLIDGTSVNATATHCSATITNAGQSVSLPSKESEAMLEVVPCSPSGRRLFGVSVGFTDGIEA
jgi:hypothetical protein